MSARFMNGFWAWYERHHSVHLFITTILFTWQLAHLFWLTTHVVALRLLGRSFFPQWPGLEPILILADYAEIPALIGATLLYMNALRKGFQWKAVGYIILINSQWLHLFWITDEFVVDIFTGTQTVSHLPYLLAWIALLIDYLELPVIFDTLKQSARIIQNYLQKRSLDKPIL